MHETTKLARRHAVDWERSFRFFLGQRTRFIFLPPHRWLRSWPPGPHRPSCSRYATGSAAIPCVWMENCSETLFCGGPFSTQLPAASCAAPWAASCSDPRRAGNRAARCAAGARCFISPQNYMQARLPMEDAEMFPQSSSLNFSRTCDLHRLAVALAVILR